MSTRAAQPELLALVVILNQVIRFLPPLTLGAKYCGVCFRWGPNSCLVRSWVEIPPLDTG
jgi:hypothetical protein